MKDVLKWASVITPNISHMFILQACTKPRAKIIFGTLD